MTTLLALGRRLTWKDSGVSLREGDVAVRCASHDLSANTKNIQKMLNKKLLSDLILTGSC